MWRDGCEQDPEQVWRDLRKLGFDDYLNKIPSFLTYSQKKNVILDDVEVQHFSHRERLEALQSHFETRDKITRDMYPFPPVAKKAAWGCSICWCLCCSFVIIVYGVAFDDKAFTVEKEPNDVPVEATGCLDDRDMVRKLTNEASGHAKDNYVQPLPFMPPFSFPQDWPDGTRWIIGNALSTFASVCFINPFRLFFISFFTMFAKGMKKKKPKDDGEKQMTKQEERAMLLKKHEVKTYKARAKRGFRQRDRTKNLLAQDHPIFEHKAIAKANRYNRKGQKDRETLLMMYGPAYMNPDKVKN